MIKYFPFPDDEYTMVMDVRPGVTQHIEVDEESYLDSLAQKDTLLAADYPFYFQALPETEPMAWETIGLLLPDMARHYPRHFQLERHGERWHWTNRLRDTTLVFTYGDASTLPLPPLDWMGRQVHEDLILMAEGEAGETFLVAGHLCFSPGWRLENKIGQSFLNIHAPIPHFLEKIGRPADLAMRRLKVGRPCSRENWDIVPTDRLSLSCRAQDKPRPVRQDITPENAGERCWLRVERQTLARLPQTRAVLFTIRTYLHRIDAVVADPFRLRRLTKVLQGTPYTTRAYKGMSACIEPLLAYLEARCREASSPPTAADKEAVVKTSGALTP